MHPGTSWSNRDSAVFSVYILYPRRYLYPSLDIGEVVRGGEQGLPFALLAQLAVRAPARRERRRVHEALCNNVHESQ